MFTEKCALMIYALMKYTQVRINQCSPKKFRSNDPHINEFTLVQYALKEIHTKVISHGKKKIDLNSILIRKSK